MSCGSRVLGDTQTLSGGRYLIRRFVDFLLTICVIDCCEREYFLTCVDFFLLRLYNLSNFILVTFIDFWLTTISTIGLPKSKCFFPD